jgi:hypothetical protein
MSQLNVQHVSRAAPVQESGQSPYMLLFIILVLAAVAT